MTGTTTATLPGAPPGTLPGAVSDADLRDLLQRGAPEVDQIVAAKRTNDLTRAAIGGHATGVWHAWCRTRHIPEQARIAHEQRIYAYHAEFSGFDLDREQVAYRALSRLDSFFMSLHDAAGVGLHEADLDPWAALNWVHTFGYPSRMTLDTGGEHLTAWHPLTDRGWALAAAGFTPAEYLAAALDGNAPTHQEAKVLAALRGHHFLPETLSA